MSPFRVNPSSTSTAKSSVPLYHQNERALVNLVPHHPYPTPSNQPGDRQLTPTSFPHPKNFSHSRIEKIACHCAAHLTGMVADAGHRYEVAMPRPFSGTLQSSLSWHTRQQTAHLPQHDLNAMRSCTGMMYCRRSYWRELQTAARTIRKEAIRRRIESVRRTTCGMWRRPREIRHYLGTLWRTSAKSRQSCRERWRLKFDWSSISTFYYQAQSTIRALDSMVTVANCGLRRGRLCHSLRQTAAEHFSRPDNCVCCYGRII